MGKLFNSIMLSGIIQLSLFLFDKQGLTFTPVLNLLLNPVAVSGADFWIGLFTSALGLTGLAGLVVGVLVIRQDWLVRSSLFTVILGWVIVPFIGFWTFLAGKLSSISNSCTGIQCSQLTQISGIGGVIAALVAGPIIAYSIWASLEYIWGGDR